MSGGLSGALGEPAGLWHMPHSISIPGPEGKGELPLYPDHEFPCLLTYPCKVRFQLWRMLQECELDELALKYSSVPSLISFVEQVEAVVCSLIATMTSRPHGQDSTLAPNLWPEGSELPVSVL